MRTLAVALALLAAATPAIACSCIEPLTPAEKREIAARIAAKSTAVADVEMVAPMDQEAMRGETYRVLKIHIGRAPASFELERDFTRGSDGSVQMTMTSCDVVPPKGQRTTVVLFATAAPGKYRIGGTCDHLFVNTPGALDLIRQEHRKLARAAERG